MSGSTSVRVSQGYEVLRPRSDQAIPIPCNEWDVLKSQISELTTEPWLFHNLGSLLIGAALATLISVLTGAINSNAANGTVIAWAAFFICLIAGALCLYFAHKERAVHRTKAQHVLTQMSLIESRFDRATT